MVHTILLPSLTRLTYRRIEANTAFWVYNKTRLKITNKGKHDRCLAQKRKWEGPFVLFQNISTLLESPHEIAQQKVQDTKRYSMQKSVVFITTRYNDITSGLGSLTGLHKIMELTTLSAATSHDGTLCGQKQYIFRKTFSARGRPWDRNTSSTWLASHWGI